MGHGLSNIDIAHAMCISPNTVSVYARSVMVATGARNRTHAVMIGLSRKIITFDELGV